MLKVYSPYKQELIKEITTSGEKEAFQALEKAHHLYSDQSKWMPAFERIKILDKVVEIMKARIDELTKTASEEGGKPYMDSKVEVLRAINGVKLAAEHIGQIKGEQIPMGMTEASQNRIAFTSREPIGVVVSISAFNHPLNLIIHQTVTAIAAGCPVIVKPASTTPLSCISFVEILCEAGLPDGWCQVVVCKSSVAEKLVCDKRVAYVSFIGSVEIGWHLRSKLAPGTRIALEHGGAAPAIVEHDADFKTMIPGLLNGGFYHAGQVCVSVQRIFVHDSIAEKLAKELTEGAKNLVVGDPLNEKTEVGPLIVPEEVNRLEDWVKEAKDMGGKVLCGGKRISNTLFEPTIIWDPPQNIKVSQQEVFGPVVCIYPFQSSEEAIQLANSIPLAFQASVFTKNIDKALGTTKKLNASAVMINDHTAFRVDWMPFGGRDFSGLGLGGIPYSIHEMTREKLIVFKSDEI